ncbi:16S rRNA (uracil(1498)-N(3))-methyltransferase [Lachnospiraceae bacterium]|jgi:16S rRNA (uracil1498-N3)-methyltransferase|nr:16S rRNA (uracil(1498)-N(3))-methyltransferase [uncultured Schaedlerella sp.]EOS39792.1 RsmE family RNA methyltransferase [Lachnospiraceae bacterium M18-1]MCI9155282.1 16S rRNA (uracil(1498)-N(3))-methyltransferase [Ruminococcus sp.]NBI60673.1 16S rRNA (uracil(1498)-N(3))-methyltransferase [Lachnospiraceae bacterium]
MHRFFIQHSQIQEKRLYVEGADVNHIKNVLRMKHGDQVMISDGEGMQYLCTLEAFESGLVWFEIVDAWKENRELPSKLYLFQGLPKSDKMELIIQKATELGVYELIPTVTGRTVVKLDEKKAQKKTARWNAIAESAAKQSGRSRIPQVREVMTFSEALAYAGDLDVLLIPYEKAEGMEATRQAVEGIRPGQSVGIFIGPEGGFEEAEVEQAMACGALPVTLGRRILRTETAGFVVLSMLLYHLE